jgi:hypothetical protein
MQQANYKEELRIFAERYMHFCNLWTVYTDLLSKKYEPSINSSSTDGTPTEVHFTIMFMLYGFFYSLVEDSDEGLNGFRLWREHFPEEEPAIAAVEAQVVPLTDGLRLFRNRLGFHGSRTRSHEARGLELFSQHSGTEMWIAMRNFKSLCAALWAKDLALHGAEGADPERARQWIDSVATRAQKR